MLFGTEAETAEKNMDWPTLLLIHLYQIVVYHVITQRQVFVWQFFTKKLGHPLMNGLEGYGLPTLTFETS